MILEVIGARRVWNMNLYHDSQSSACMGWIWFQPTEATKALLDRAVILVETNRDDQIAFNYAMEDLWYWQWNNRTELSYTTFQSEPKLMVGATIGLGHPRVTTTTDDLSAHSPIPSPAAKVLILPFDVITRYCRDVIRAYRKDSMATNATDGQILGQSFPDAFIMHCYTPKSGEDKLFWFRRWDLLLD